MANGNEIQNSPETRLELTFGIDGFRYEEVEVRPNKELPSFIQVLTNLEHRSLTGYPARRANREMEKSWSQDLKARLNKCSEKPNTFAAHVLCEYILFLQYNDTKEKNFAPEYEENIASIIKDYLLTYTELVEYKYYSTRLEKR